MAMTVLSKPCAILAQKYSDGVRNLTFRLGSWANTPFFNGPVLSALAGLVSKVSGISTPFWPIFQTVFGISAGLHTTVISPATYAFEGRSCKAVFLKSLVAMSWCLRVGAINSLVFSVLKPLILLRAENFKAARYFCHAVSVALLFPAVATPVCGLTTGALIVTSVAVASALSKYAIESKKPVVTLRSNLPAVTNSDSTPGQRKPVFFDEELKTFYYRPLFDKFRELGWYFQKLGDYGGICFGCGERYFENSEGVRDRCDIVTFRKRQSQVEYEDWIKGFRSIERKRNSFFQRLIFRLEREGILFALEILSAENFPEDIKVQKEVILQLLPSVLRERLASWQYSSFLILDEEEQLKRGYPVDTAKRELTMFLFYKRVAVFELC